MAKGVKKQNAISTSPVRKNKELKTENPADEHPAVVATAERLAQSKEISRKFDEKIRSIMTNTEDRKKTIMEMDGAIQDAWEELQAQRATKNYDFYDDHVNNYYKG